MRRTTLFRRAAVTAAAPLLAVSLVACGGEPETAAEETSSAAAEPTESEAAAETPAEGEEVDREQFVEDLAAAMEDAESAKMDMSMDIGAQGKLDIESQVDYTTTPPSMAMTMNNPAAEGQSMDIRLIDSVMYMNMGQLSQDKFFQMDLNDPQSPMGDMSELTDAMDPRTSFESYAEGLKKVVFVGEEDVDGEQLAHYRMTLDPKQIEAMGGAAGQGGQKLPKTITYDLWLDDQDRMRQVELDLEQLGAMTIDVHDWNEPVDIVKPKKSEITEMPGS